MANTFQKILGKGKEPVTEKEEEIIYQMLLNGSRKSAVLSNMLEQGYDKEQLKEVIEKKSKEVKEYKKSDVGIKEMVEINRKRIKNGLIAFVLGIVLTTVMYVVSGVLDSVMTYVFYGAIFWGIFTFFRGLIGLSVYKTREQKSKK
jgi:hypothetical protein